MGRVKDWAMTEQYCIVCDQGFWPFQATHEVDIGAPTCSRQCYNEYCQVSEALADLTEEQCEECAAKFPPRATSA